MDPLKDFFRRHHALPVSDRNGAARYEDATAAQLADWLRDRDTLVRAGNTALARERGELVAACKGRLAAATRRDRDEDAAEIGVLFAVLARCGE